MSIGIPNIGKPREVYIVARISEENVMIFKLFFFYYLYTYPISVCNEYDVKTIFILKTNLRSWIA